MFYNTKMEALSGSMERYILSQKQQKPYRLYQGDELVFESVYLEEVEEEIEDILHNYLKNEGIKISVPFDDKTWNNLQKYLKIKIIH